MSDVIRVANGAAPWQPTATSQIVETFSFYDQPLQGILEQDGLLYLFDCLYGHVEGLSLWLYTMVLKSEVDSLLALENIGDFDEFRGQLHKNERGVLALAIEDYGIIVSGIVEDTRELPTMAGELAHQYLDTVERLRRHSTEAEELEGSDRSRLLPARS